MSVDTLPREFVFADDRPFASCHASTILPVADGELLVAWFAGPYEGHPEVAIWLSRRTPDGWSRPLRVASEPGLPHWNPVLCRSPGGLVHLFYKVGPDVPRWMTRVVTSADEGRSWTTPRQLDLLEGFPPGPVKDKPIVLSDGIWLAPTSRETALTWDAAAAASIDGGETWTLSAPVPLNHADFPGKGVIQPALWESPDSHVHMLLRSTAGRIYRSDSTDSGATWSAAYPTALPNNNSGIDLERLPDGRLVLCVNPVGQNWGKRTPLVLSLSSDNGGTWTTAITLEDEDLPGGEAEVALNVVHRANEFSYPALVCDGRALHISYTWKRERICYRRLPLMLLDQNRP